MAKMASLHAGVRGLVQGVFFRAFVAQKANALGVTGWVRNLPNGSEVEVLAEGDDPSLKKLLEYLQTGPQGARVTKVTAEWGDYSDKYKHFEIKY